jgi:AraC family transcriptional regulator, transcriptional activator of pobA
VASRAAAPAVRVLPFKADPARAIAVEVQRLDVGHPAAGFSHHAHRFVEVIVFERGSGEHRIGSQVFQIAPGEVHRIPAGIPHSLTLSADSVGRILMFEQDEVAEGASSPTALLGHQLLAQFTVPSVVQPEPAQLAKLHEALDALDGELSGATPLQYEAVSALLRLVLVALARVAPESAPRSIPPGGIVAEALAIVDLRFREHLTLGEIAATMNRDAGRLSADVRRATGRTLVQWIEERRMAEARRMLRETDLPVAAIASETGFSDPAYFARRFTRQHGESAGRWREHARGAGIVH